MVGRIGKHIVVVLLIIATLSIIILSRTKPSDSDELDCVLIPDGFVSWWPGDGNAADLVGGNDGILGTGTTFAPGYVEQSFDFDGLEGYVNIPDELLGYSLDGFSELTIDAWIKPESLGWNNPDTGGNTAAIVSKYDSTKANGISFSLHMENGNLRFAVLESTSPESNVSILSSEDVPLYTWSHVAAVWGGGLEVLLFLNGEEFLGTIFSNGPPPDKTAENDVPTNIGRIESFSGTYTGPAGFFDGQIDEVEIFSRALSSSEIQTLYTAGSYGKCKDNIPTPSPTTTPLPKDFLPVFMKYPTPTPTATPSPIPSPTPTPQPRPRLNDGYYFADMGDQGSIRFRVSGSGTVAGDANFAFKVHPWCDWSVEVFHDQASINNGFFQLQEIDVVDRSFGGELRCWSMSHNEAFCGAWNPHADSRMNCDYIEGWAIRQ